MGVMKMGNIAPRDEIEPTPPAFWTSMLTITPPRLPDITKLPTSTLSVRFLSLPVRLVWTTTLVPLEL